MDEILNLIESISEGFPSYFYINIETVQSILQYLEPLTRIYMFDKVIYIYIQFQCKSRKENPQKLTQLSSRSHPRHIVGKRTAQKDIKVERN